MSMSAISNMTSIGFDKLAEAYPGKQMGAASSALKGSMDVQEMIQKDIAQMMKDVSPHLGQQLDISV